MVNVQKLKAKIVECNLTQKQLADVMNINPSTLNRKINNVDGSMLTVKEANILIGVLKIENPNEIFFTK